MREIKFRAWITELNKWADEIEVFQDGSYILSSGTEGYMINGYEGFLMQYTGLKDKNGKEICEGDIVKLKIWFGDTFTCGHLPIIFHEACFGYELYSGSGDSQLITLSDGEHENIEVIGNIYENPELLETT